MKKLLMVVFCLAQCLLAQAQIRVISVEAPLPPHQPFQKTTYFGTHQEFFTITSLLPDSSVYRVDTYQLVDQAQVYGYQYDNSKVAIRQGPTKILYPTGQVYLNCDYHQGALNGPLMVFYSNGAIKRRELYQQGLLQESHCYSAEGHEQACQPLYQGPRFKGNPKDLKRSLEKSLQPVMEQYQLTNLAISLTINELGQLVKTEVASADSTISHKVQSVLMGMPQWRADQLNWEPARMDEVAISEKLLIRVDRRKGFLYVYL